MDISIPTKLYSSPSFDKESLLRELYTFCLLEKVGHFQMLFYGLTMTAFDHMKTGNVHPPEPLNGATSEMLIDLADYVGFIDM